MTGHVMAQTKPAAPTLDTLMRTDLDVPVSDALTEMDLDAPATTNVAAAKANVAPAMLYESKDPELVAADIGRWVNLRGAGLTASAETMTPPDLPAGTPLHLVAPRGGYASALAVARGRKLIGLKAAVTPLQGPDGAIPPASVRVRWLTGQSLATIFSERPARGPIQPVLLTVRAPESQAPGTYTGKISVSGPFFNGALDVKLEVAAWQVPPPKDWPMLTGLVHSPDSIALQYKVEPWSDEHLKRMEPSLELLRDMGSESCYLHLISEANYYERYSIVRWKENTPDFACVDKYLDLWQKVCGPPRKVTLHVWEGNRQPHYNATNSVSVTRDTGGKLETFKAPYYDTPEALAFWKPVFDGIRDRVAKRGWKDTEILLGLPWDCHPSEEAIEFFRQAAPGWRWRVFTHGFNVPLPQADGKLVFPNGSEVGWIEGTSPMGYGQMVGKHPGLIKSAQMKRVYPFTLACREQVQPAAQAWLWREAPCAAVRSGNQGLSQVGLDYWEFDFEKYKPRPPNVRTSLLLVNGTSGFNPRHDLAKSITAPGPNGAEPTLRYELLREGLQAAAALVAARETPGGKEFEAFMKARLDHYLLYVTYWPKDAPPPDRAVASQDRWNVAVKALYQSAATAPWDSAKRP